MPPPLSLQINGWSGAGDTPTASPAATAWQWATAGRVTEVLKTLAPAAPVDQKNWRHEDVGWGLVLPDDASVSEKSKALGEDAPPALRRLLDDRPNSPVLRYVKDLYTHLRRYYVDRPKQDIALGVSKPGTRPGSLPTYLLIYGSPAEIPWRFQYLLSGPCRVGRLWLEDQALDRYVDHVMNEWSDSSAQMDSTLVWAVDWGGDDITSLMRRSIAAPLVTSIEDDPDPNIARGVRFVDGTNEDASAAVLVTALSAGKPGLVVTTSHGKTGPIGDETTMGRDLGLLVDSARHTVQPADVVAAWQPNGAIWYAHACCSAGTTSESGFSELVERGSEIDKTLQALEELGDRVAPFPTALLEADKPLRAFVGHVEPTFDWTIRDPRTGQMLTHALRTALYNHLYQPEPVALAFRSWYEEVGYLLAQWDQALVEYNAGGSWELAAALRLAARDRQAMVVLGEPTVMLPPLTG